MNSKVRFSTYSKIVSVLTVVLLVVVFWFAFREGGTIAWITIAAVMVGLLVGILLYMPLSIEVDDTYIIIHTPAKSRRIPLASVEYVRRVSPTMAEKRICGSSGFCGYWGWFTGPTLGRYFAYYGKASDCFMVHLKDDSQYLLSCSDPESVCAFIESKI